MFDPFDPDTWSDPQDGADPAELLPAPGIGGAVIVDPTTRTAIGHAFMLLSLLTDLTGAPDADALDLVEALCSDLDHARPSDADDCTCRTVGRLYGRDSAS